MSPEKTSHEKMNVEREAFWAALAAAAPELQIDASPGWEKEIPLGEEGPLKNSRLKFKMSLSQDKTSVYLVARSAEAEAWVMQNLDALARGLRTVAGAASGEAELKRWFRKDIKAAVTVRSQWPEAIRWLRAQHKTFAEAVQSVEKN